MLEAESGRFNSRKGESDQPPVQPRRAMRIQRGVALGPIAW